MKNYTIHLLKRNVIQNKLNAYYMYINRNMFLIAVRIEQYSYIRRAIQKKTQQNY